MSSYAAEIVHLIKHAARQEMQDMRVHYFGHMSAYRRDLHAVRVLIPTLRDENGNMYETGWLPLGTIVVGQGFGIQYAPMAQATADDLTKGEQCQVMLFDRSTGCGAIAGLMFNDNANPPGRGSQTGATEDPADPNGTNGLEQGEILVMDQNGSFSKFYKNGDLQMYAAGNLTIRSGKDITIIAGKDLTIKDNGGV